MDSQSVEGLGVESRRRTGYDAARGVKRSKRHVAIDTLGLLLTMLGTRPPQFQSHDTTNPLPLEPAPHISPSIKLSLGRQQATQRKSFTSARPGSA